MDGNVDLSDKELCTAQLNNVATLELVVLVDASLVKNGLYD